jgi:hypothetical protein
MESYVYIDAADLMVPALRTGELSIFERLIYKIKSRNMIPVIPQISIGETVVKMLDKVERRSRLSSFTDLFAKFLKLVESGAVLQPLSDIHIEYVKDIIEVDNRIRGNDLFILAQAIADPRSRYLITSDTAILYSEGVGDYIDRLMKEGKREVKLEIVPQL